jgi:hypothetical protein
MRTLEEESVPEVIIDRNTPSPAPPGVEEVPDGDQVLET